MFYIIHFQFKLLWHEFLLIQICILIFFSMCIVIKTGRTCQPRLHIKNVLILTNIVVCSISLIFWSWTNYAHVTKQNIKSLWHFIYLCCTDKLTECKHTVVILQSSQPYLTTIHSHRAEFITSKNFTMQSHSTSFIYCRSRTYNVYNHPS